MEMLPVWSILFLPLVTAFLIVGFLQRYERAAAGAALASITAVLVLILALPFMTVSEASHPGARSLLEPKLDAYGELTGEYYIYRENHRILPDAGLQGAQSLTGWRIRAQKSTFDWARISPRQDRGTPLPLGVPRQLEESGLGIEFGVMVDNLAYFMLLVVGVIGFLVHLFSIGYLADEGAWGRYFAGLQLFCFSMLGIVVSPNYLQTFLFWELVGVSSYILIGHYYDRDYAADAGKKAFMTNRVADFGFMVGILMLLSYAGTVDFSDLANLPAAMPELFGYDASGIGTWIGILLFVGCMGKSAQFPFHIWLPDAMAGPTPVSALMHAATMVAAGVYLVIRSYPVYNAEALRFIAWVGIVTALLSALIAVVQYDLKKVLAYSTLSQLGYMMMVLGVAGYAEHAVSHGALSVEVFRSQCYTAGMFHLTTHAFFKGLLFLAAGAVIVGMHHQQDMRQMGGLFSRMPITAVTFGIGSLALAGFWPFSGFWSKDLILHLAHQGHPVLYVLASAAAFLTAFYMGRAFLMTFLGEGRSRQAEYAHEVGGTMWVPLVVLAFLAAVSGVWGQSGVPGFETALGQEQPFGFLVYYQVAWSPHLDLTVAFLSNVIGLIALLVAYLIYGAGIISADWYTGVPGLSGLYLLVEKKFYCDDIALFLVRKVQDTLAMVLDLLEQHLLIGLGVYGVAGLFRRLGDVLRYYQTGNVRSYASLLVLGTLLVLFLVTFSGPTTIGLGG